MQFCPFVNNLLASAADDGKVKLWVIPEGGFADHESESDATLSGHTKKVVAIQWHRSADNTLFSTGMDNTVRIWDVEAQKQSMMYSDLNSQPSCFRISPDGSKVATVVKGGNMFYFDPRQSTAAI